MRFSIIAATLFATIAVAMPNLPRGYTGSCSRDNCGGKACTGGSICVSWPSSNADTRKGCVCSSG
ncbi:hypothetical protein LEMA_uP003680.1 [Plenodomus lingam JN3]|uniref:Uncharacterized protein n=1 Tax=Leptosphaeria maculans (strain JN3 / isolate v23.1.3 / race Av1-4-5-6-7-8) TaxID=985895 RepID=E5AEE2_LEPMJ|nr:hypothetical protein LEMA_uP003680.1 [Plenodomus lingam JN3]CBY01581.1 hypothetical protein LEMA_uP003680.1 [Plenodomus lingam JN3]